MKCSCSVVVDGASFFDDFYGRPVEGDLDVMLFPPVVPDSQQVVSLENADNFQKRWWIHAGVQKLIALGVCGWAEGVSGHNW